ncbi:MAG: hypothetical protein K9W44_03080 [Candidatus Lokiarchaeota archaeon]|nr:hypothetical protein [Candidatus Harpocratesius repetitus]
MTLKKITVTKEIWEKLTEIKKDLQETQKEQEIGWDNVFIMFLKNYEISKEKEELLAIPTKLNNNSISSKSNQKLDPTLGIPPAPKKKPIKVDIDKKQMRILAKKETKSIKYILIECNMCGSKPILMPVPKKLVLESKDPVVDISYVHGNPEHVIVAQLDHDFQVRRRRVSQVVYEKDYS